jgi:predicted hotdog family 3-hydroxylacyl-ACP dehydratase
MSVSTGELRAYMPHRPPMVWVNEVLETKKGERGLVGTCLVDLRIKSHFHRADGTVRPSAIIEWIAQGYGYAKACQRKKEGFGLTGFGRALLMAISNCEVSLGEIEKQDAVIVHVTEVREMHPVYMVDGKVTNLSGDRVFGSARITVLGGEVPSTESKP